MKVRCMDIKTTVRCKYKPKLVDLHTIIIDKSLPAEERMISFIKQIKDPYHFRVGKTKVNLLFADTTDSLNDMFVKMIESKMMG